MRLEGDIYNTMGTHNGKEVFSEENNTGGMKGYRGELTFVLARSILVVTGLSRVVDARKHIKFGWKKDWQMK